MYLPQLHRIVVDLVGVGKRLGHTLFLHASLTPSNQLRTLGLHADVGSIHEAEALLPTT